ncbi:hypothetical protein PIB30_059830 [Stylosanthes scabra]|uniref:Putative plant transposon protein domain-containing protein n=1 Tax=Stylosanthes scabra TaxID=79078 RepID=A0ABU6TMS8_9FABA|nr:hypothetical protein [Stylosanthes scabra]
MASSSSTISVFDAHRFRKAHNEQLFDSYARRRKVIPEVGFNLEDDESPEIMEQIALRGWRRLATPRMDISKLLVQEFYANAAVSDEEAAAQEELPYKNIVRGKEIDFSPNNIRRVMRFKRETAGAQTDYKTRQALSQRLDEVLAELCIPGATWKLSSSQPPVPIKLRRTELQPLARGWQEFIIHSPVPTGKVGNHNIKGYPNPHHYARGRCEGGGNHSQQYGNNSSRIGKQGESCTSKHYLQIVQGCRCSFEGICKNSKDSVIELHYGKEDGNNKEVKQIKEKQEQIYNHNQRFHAQIWQEQEKLAKEVQEVRRGQLAQVAANNKRLEMERNMQMALERQGRDIVEIRKQVNLWTNNVSSKEAYGCWAQQQANPNLSEIPITQIPDIMRTNVEKGRPLFHGFLDARIRKPLDLGKYTESY